VRSVLVHDGDCVYCSAAARALRRLGDVGTVPWIHEVDQEFLEEQFGEVPFVMFPVGPNAGVVYGGRSAAKELADGAGVPSLASDLASAEYDTISKVVGVASRRERQPDDYHSAYDTHDGLNAEVEALFEAAGYVPRSTPG